MDKKRIPGHAFLILVLGASLPLLGCGGSGGGGGTSTSSQNTYTISGTVSGLSGTGLALQNNGSDYLLITGSGSFSFDKPIPSGGVYNVTIDGEPDNPIQLCLVANGSGSANANITSVQITCTTPVERALYNFGDAPDGISPQSNLVFDSSGNLYGTTIEGGLYGSGTVFKLTPSQGQWTETVLYSFCSQTPNCTDGGVPHAGLVFDAEGNLYGTASQRGAANGGVVFELMPHSDGSWTESVLHSFGNGTDGNSPYSGVVFDNLGNLYGTTSGGGKGLPGGLCQGCGTVYELSPGPNGQWTESVVYDFCSQTNCVDGGQPFGGVVLDSSGNLYGTTYLGGTVASGDGTVFELTPSGGGQWTETVLYSFQGGTNDGANPRAGVIMDKSGNLYGTTEYGYESIGLNNGVVYGLKHESGGQWKESVLYGFCSSLNVCADGGGPEAGLVSDNGGNLYGTTTDGGSFQAYGVVYALTPGAAGGMWSEVPLYSFGGEPSAGFSVASLILDNDGNLYGTSGGGTDGSGFVFEVTP